MAEFVMPQLGADMKAGKLLGWRKKVGDRVSRGDIIADVETEKADIEVEVFATGVIEKILVEPGKKVPIGTLLAIIREEGKPVAIGPQPVAPVTPPVPIHAPALVPAAKAAVSRPPGTPGPTRLRISPAARKLAGELQVDPAQIEGTGPGGRVTLEDVRRAAKAKIALPSAEATEVALDRRALIRQTIAAAMTRAKREIPHYYLSTTIDMSKTLAWLAQENLKRSIEERLVYGVLLLKAVALALREIPELNALWTESGIKQSSDVHVGVAISLRGGGLVAPALHHTDRLPLNELMKSFRDLVQRARAGSLRSSEMSDPTITVTNLGEQGVETVFGIIYPPQVALVGFGKIAARPWSLEGQIVSRPIVTASLSADHRVSDGHRGALFLNAIDRILQEPDNL
jgi:pyruvate dehydrogenase E2 component (dihydrolipoyllysine-residue acetyltransferase)